MSFHEECSLNIVWWFLYWKYWSFWNPYSGLNTSWVFTGDRGSIKLFIFTTSFISRSWVNPLDLWPKVVQNANEFQLKSQLHRSCRTSFEYVSIICLCNCIALSWVYDFDRSKYNFSNVYFTVASAAGRPNNVVSPTEEWAVDNQLEQGFFGVVGKSIDVVTNNTDSDVNSYGGWWLHGLEKFQCRNLEKNLCEFWIVKSKITWAIIENCLNSCI